jgi:hypothetical protein
MTKTDSRVKALEKVIKPDEPEEILSAVLRPGGLYETPRGMLTRAELDQALAGQRSTCIIIRPQTWKELIECDSSDIPGWTEFIQAADPPA